MATRVLPVFSEARHVSRHVSAQQAAANIGVTYSRRACLRMLALGLGVLAARGVTAEPATPATYVGIETSPGGRSSARFFTETGAAIGQTQLDFRAHGMAEHQGSLVVFPRRPGNTFAVIDIDTLTVRAVVTAPEGRHFFGHGAFSADGQTLLVAENDLTTLQGAIGHYDMSGPMRRLGRLPLPGPGPHEIARTPNGDVFAIALGGLKTHPDYGRDPLNLHNFRSQVLFYDLARGDLTPLGYWPGSEGVSLRHLAFDGLGRLYIGGQIPGGSPSSSASVVWLVEGETVTALDVAARFGGYVSSVAADQTRALVSSKVTGQIVELNGADVLGAAELNGASAVALKGGIAARAGFTLLNLNDQSVAVSDAHEFDNHGILF